MLLLKVSSCRNTYLNPSVFLIYFVFPECFYIVWSGGSPASLIQSPSLLKCGCFFSTRCLRDLHWKGCSSFAPTQIPHREALGTVPSPSSPGREAAESQRNYFKSWRLMSRLKQMLWWWYLWILYLLFQTRRLNINSRYQYHIRVLGFCLPVLITIMISTVKT